MTLTPHQIKRLAAFNELPFNYDATQYSPDQPEWNIDAYATELPSEPPGPPTSAGSFAAAQEILVTYRFPDPHRIRGYFDPDSPLDGRTMLLEGKFLFLTFDFGVRITRVIDDTSEEDGETVSRFGYAYRTLKDHWEIGEITFMIVKHHNSGKVRFLINAYSRPDRIPNFFYRIGFRLLGRRLQKQFAHQSLKRMKSLVQQQLATSENT